MRRVRSVLADFVPSAVGVDSRSTQKINNNYYNGNTGGSVNGNTNGQRQISCNLDILKLTMRRLPASAASTQTTGWGNTFYLSLLVFAFFAYRCTPNPIRG